MVVAIRDTAHSSVIFGSLAEIYTRQTYTDVVFHCADGRPVRAHRLLLSSISPFLQSLCLGQEQFDLVEISIPEVNSYDLDNVMRYCYEGLIRLDQEEFPIFEEIVKSLGIKIPNEILKGERQEEEKSENSLVLPVQTQNSGSAREVAVNRKIEKRKNNENCAEEVRPKVRKMETQLVARENMVDFFNRVQNDFRKKNANQTSTGGPILVPLEHFQKVVALVEQRKVEKKLEALVDATVRKTMRRIQEGLKNRIESRKMQLSMRFPNKPSNASMPIGNTSKDAGNLSRGGTSISPAQKPPPAPTTGITENIAGSSRGSGSSTPPVQRQPLASVGSTSNVGNLQERRSSIPPAQMSPLVLTGVRKIVPRNMYNIVGNVQGSGPSVPPAKKPPLPGVSSNVAGNLLPSGHCTPPVQTHHSKVILLQKPLQKPTSDTFTKSSTSQNTVGTRNLFPATTLAAPNLPAATTVGLSNPASATAPPTTSILRTNSVAPFRLVLAAGKHAIVRAPNSNLVSAASPPNGTALDRGSGQTAVGVATIQASPGLVMHPQTVKTYARSFQSKSLSKDNTF